MSHTKSLENPENGRNDTKETVSSDSSSLDGSVRQRVLKEVGLTSTSFIGPAFPPNKAEAKPDIEDTLSEFYKELERIDAPGGANDNPGTPHAGLTQPPTPSKTSPSKDVVDGAQEVNANSGKADHYPRGSGQKQPPWPHWYHNEPYNPRRPRPDMDVKSDRAAATQWHRPPALNRPPDPGFHRPPFHHRPPPPPAFPNPPKPPSHVGHNWNDSGATNHYQEESHFPTFPDFPPPDACGHPSQGFYGDSPHRVDGDQQGWSYDAHSCDVHVGWSTDRNEDYDRQRRYDSENELWEHHCQPPDDGHWYHSPLVLILMRGLPGSGKSTLARELLSTGPSGLILSTDDFFAHRGGYRYDAGLLGAAHEWNQSRAEDAMHEGRSPIIIDNTNIQAWEMKPYVKMALDKGYRVDFCEPDTSWKFDPYELEKRNKHNVPQEKIAQMMDRFSFPISVDIVMSSQEPLHVNQRRRPEQPHMMRKTQDFY